MLEDTVMGCDPEKPLGTVDGMFRQRSARELLQLILARYYESLLSDVVLLKQYQELITVYPEVQDEPAIGWLGQELIMRTVSTLTTSSAPN